MAHLISLLFFAYVAAVAVYIVTENRRPQSTFAWMFLFVTLPLVGLAIYILFGRQRKTFSRKGKLVRQDLPGHLWRTLAPMRAQHDRAMGRMAGPGLKLATLMQSNGHSLVTSDNRLRVLQNAQETYPALTEDLRNARVSIHLQYFGWGSDRFGGELKALLFAKVAEGVEVRLLYDPVGSFTMLRWRYVREMRRGGIDMRPFSSLWRLHTISYRNYRKIVVIDGTIGYTGGLNIGGEHNRPRPRLRSLARHAPARGRRRGAGAPGHLRRRLDQRHQRKGPAGRVLLPTGLEGGARRRPARPDRPVRPGGRPSDNSTSR